MGNCTHVTETVGGVTREIRYTYDSLYRLTAADYSTGEYYGYQYDPVGNREVMTDAIGVHTYTYDAANRLTSIQLPDSSIQGYTWDQRGNLLADGTFTYTYSAAGRMVRAESITATLVYTYNADGLRVARSQSVASVQSVDTFTWDWATPSAGSGQARVPELLSDNDSLYLIGYDTLGWQRGDDWTFVLPDALGSVRQETDAAGAVTATREWSPYGEEVGGAQTGLGFTGEWYDTGVGLQYLRARWYAPINGVFVSRDPVESEPPYQYVRGNPIRWTDPSGCIIEPWNAGDEYFYSCKCGWIDLKHAEPRKDLIKAVLDVRLSSMREWDTIAFSRPQDSLGLSFVTSASFSVRRAGIMGDGAKEIALGINIAWENFFEEIGQGSHLFAGPVSTFSEEDLVSDLIGFHRGLRGLKGDNEETTLNHFMELCGVVGYEYYEMGKGGDQVAMRVFRRLQRQIALEYLAENGLFRKHDQWGTRPAGRWSGQLTLDRTGLEIIPPLPLDPHACSSSFSCDQHQEQLPWELVSVTPQSPGRNWVWKSGRLIWDEITWIPGDPYAYPIIRRSNVTDYTVDELNNRKLNWGPTGQ